MIHVESAKAPVRTRRSAHLEFTPRPALHKRLGSALRRRAVHAWSRWTVGERPPAVEAAFAWLAATGAMPGLPAVRGDTAACPGMTGAALETAMAYGQSSLVRQWGRWLLSTQLTGGAFPNSGLQQASLFNTGQALCGLLAAEEELPGASPAARRAGKFLVSRLEAEKSGQWSVGSGQWSDAKCGRGGDSFDAWAPQALRLTCLPPLIVAARRWKLPDWEQAAWRTLHYYQRTIDLSRWDAPTHLFAHWTKALIELSQLAHQADPSTLSGKPFLLPTDHCPLTTAHCLPAALQRTDGSVPVLPTARWVSASGLALLANCWYQRGEHERGHRAMACLSRRQRASGGFPGSWGPGARYHSQRESTWAVKFFLDAALLQVQAAFMAEDELPQTIDPADGRWQAVRTWFQTLGSAAKVADIGCGKGRYLKRLAAEFPKAQLTGIDLSPTLLAHLPENIEGRQGSLLRISAAAGEFDGAIAIESLEHALLPQQAIQELCRIVRPGGQILIIDKHRDRQPLSHYKPWEQWFTLAQVSQWLAPHCDQVAATPLLHGDDRYHGLFVAWSGRRACE